MAIDNLSKESRSLIGSELDLGPGADEVCRPLIRYWCEAFEDANKTYVDEAFAGGTFYRGVIAPSALAASVSRRPFWPAHQGNIFGLIGIVGDRLGLPESVVQRVDFDFLLPLRLGDRVRCVERVVDISSEKVTALGTGQFVILERRYHNERDDLISRATLTFFKYARGSVRKSTPHATAEAEGTPSSPRAEVSDSDQRHVAQPDRLSTGDTLPSMTLSLTVTRMVMMAYVSRDFNPIHHDMEYARANGAPHMIVQWACYAGMFGRFLTDWAGPLAWIKRISFQMQRMNCPGDELLVTGIVTRAYREDDHTVAEVAMSMANQNGITTPGSALVTFP